MAKAHNLYRIYCIYSTESVKVGHYDLPLFHSLDKLVLKLSIVLLSDMIIGVGRKYYDELNLQHLVKEKIEVTPQPDSDAASI